MNNSSPRPSIAELQQIAAAHVALPSRMVHVCLLAASLTMAVAIGSLWATEASLPPRTQVAFALIVAIAVAWAIFAAWVLARRRVLYGADRVIAARMGLAFSALGAAGMAALGYWGGLGSGAYTGALVQIGFSAAAGVLLARARRHVDALTRRRRELETQLAITRDRIE
jgi:hypothetical protein